MYPILFHLRLFGFDAPIHSYGVMLAVAFFACLFAGQWLGKQYGINPELFLNAVLLAIVTGLIGARLCDVLENFHDFTRSDLSILQNLGNALNFRSGGLTFYGGFLLATPCCILYAIYHRIPVLRGMDVVAPVILIGLGVGRIGCLLNGCCFGQSTHLPWAMRFATSFGPVHPTQIYSSITAFLLAGILICYLTLPHLDGRVFALMLMLEGISRFVLELLRIEASVLTFHFAGQDWGWSLSMVIGLQCFVAGVILWLLLPWIHAQRQLAAA